jgi:hypothetical protein
MKIEEAIERMMRENTGRHMLDSGGANGRNWQRNQGVDFKKIPDMIYDGEYLHKSTYRFLVDNLRDTNLTTLSLQNRLNKYVKLNDSYYGAMEDMIEFLKSSGVHYQGAKNVSEIENTYNYENAIDGVLQYFVFESADKAYICLQVHGGADVRGGYTAPKIFEIADIDNFTSELYNISIPNVYSDDSGCHFYSDDNGENVTEKIDFRPDGIYYTGEMIFAKNA